MKWAALMLPQEMARTKSHGFLECIYVVTEVSLILGHCANINLALRTCSMTKWLKENKRLAAA